MNNTDKNLCYDKQPFIMNYSQPVSTHSYNSFNMTTIDFPTEIAVVPQHQESSDSSRNFAIYNVTNQIAMQPQQTLPILSYLKFYHFYVNFFYLVTCKIVYQEDYFFEDNVRYSHEFFYQHPNDSTRYHVTCKSLQNSLVENILNDEICEMNFDVELLSLNQKFNLEQSVRQQLFHRMHCNRNTNSFHNDVVDHEMITQPVSMPDIQNYNDGDFPNNDITHRDTNGLDIYPQQDDDFNNFVLQNNFRITR
jgi:hypothetical protein